MANVTLTQIQLIQAKSTVSQQPGALYWNTDSASPINIDSTKVISVAYAWDSATFEYVPGAVQVTLANGFAFFTSNSYASVSALIL
jgi:hypothetical protein